MRRRSGMLVLGVSWLLIGSWVSDLRGQVYERDVSVTGPRGRTIERSIRSERGPGFVDRQIQIQRPGGTFERDVRIQRSPAPGVQVGGGGGGMAWGRPGPNLFVERNVFVGPGPIVVAPPLFGGLFFGSFLAPPPPPIVVAAPPIVVNPATVVAAPPRVVVAADPVMIEIERLHSIHSNTRRDASIALGRLGDSRAVPALIDHLKNDYSKDVRMAAAWGLAEIKDPTAAIPLERAALFDKRHEVREAAAVAYKRIPTESEQVVAKQASPPARRVATRVNPRSTRTSPALGHPGNLPTSPARPTREKVPPPPVPAEPQESAPGRSPFAPESESAPADKPGD